MSLNWNYTKPSCCDKWLVLPTVYSDALSYGEQLDKFCYQLNQLIENNNILPDFISEMIKEYINSGAIGEVVRDILADYILNVKYPPKGIAPAVGDGSADDTAAIQGCIDYAAENGGVVYFPYGSYLTQPLTMKDGVSLFGFDRYSTKIVLKGGATKSLIGGTVEDFSIANLTLDGNSGIQVNEVNVVTIIGTNVLFTNLIIKDGYTLVNYSGNDGHFQISDIVFGNAVKECLFTTGNADIQCENVVFNNLSAVSGISVMNIGTDGGFFNVKSIATCNRCIVVTGNNNKISAIVENADIPIVDNGLQNNIEIFGISNKEFYSGDTAKNVNGNYSKRVGGTCTKMVDGNANESVDGNFSSIVKGIATETFNNARTVNENNKTVNNTGMLNETISGRTTRNYNENYVENVNGNKSVVANDSEENLSGDKNIAAINSTEKLSGNKVIESAELILKSKEPITYQNPIDDGNGFNHVTMKDANGNVYNVLVEGGFNPEAVKTFNTRLKWRMVRERFSDYYPKTDRNQPVYTTIQGACVVGNYLYALFPNGNSGTPTNDTEIIQFDKRDGSIINRYYATLGHGNDICYNDVTNKFYCITNEYWDGTEFIRLKKLFILNNLFEIEKTVNTDITCYGCTWHKGKLLTIKREAPYNEVYEINVDTGATTLFTTIKKPFTAFPPTLQTLSSTGNMLAITVAFPNNIWLFDDDGNISGTIPFKDVVGWIPIQEAEFADYDKETGNFICGGFFSNYSYDFNVFFEVGNVLDDSIDVVGVRTEWVVDNSKYVPLPDGSGSKPFYTVGEIALLCIYKYIYSRPATNIKPTSNEYLYEELTKLSAEINGNNSSVSGWLVTDGNVQINGVNFTGENANSYLVGCLNGSVSMGTNTFAENKKIYLKDARLSIGNPRIIPNDSITAYDSTIIVNGSVTNKIFSNKYDNVTILAQTTSTTSLNSLPFDDKCIVNYARYWRCNNGVFNQYATHEVSIDDIAKVSRYARVRINTLNAEVMGRYLDGEGKVMFDYFYLNGSDLCRCSVVIDFVNKAFTESAIKVADGSSTSTPYHDYNVYFLPYYD